MIKAVNSAHFQPNDPPFLLLPPSFFHDEIDVSSKQSSSYYGILEQSIIYSTKSAEYCMIIYWTVDSTRRWITAALAATKLKTLLTHHITLMHRANIMVLLCTMHPVGCRSITYAESYRRIFIIVLVDTIHVRQSLEMRLLTSTYSTVINTRKILLILISSSIHHNIQGANKIIYNNQLYRY